MAGTVDHSRCLYDSGTISFIGRFGAWDPIEVALDLPDGPLVAGITVLLTREAPTYYRDRLGRDYVGQWE